MHNLTAAGHVLKVYASNAAPNPATAAIKTDVAEISAANGYPAAGTDVQNAVSRTGGTVSITGVDVVWTASGGSFGPLRYILLFNETQTAPVDPLIAFWDYGVGGVTINDSESFTVDVGTSLFTLA